MQFAEPLPAARDHRGATGARRIVASAARALLLALTLAMGAGCGDAGPAATTSGDATEGSDDGLAEYDPTGDALLLQLDLIEATVTAARDALRTAATAAEPAAARSAVIDARTLLLAEGTPTDGPMPLLPAATAERDAASDLPTDLLTATATLAGDDVSPRARTVLELLRDPIAGDLGAWQRDAEGMVTLVGEVADAALAAGDALDAAEAAVRELDGEATRALAWTSAASEALEAGRPDLAREHAARGAAHLEVVRLGIGLARDALLADPAADA